MEWDALVQEAFTARKTAYTPYSGFAVGAALLTKNGKIYRGCNIENAAHSPTNCAERTAIFTAVSDGIREFDAIAICGGYDGAPQFCFPCGVCRQVLMEFCNPETFVIIIAKSETEYRSYLLKEILPYGFGPDNLK
ncbi:MAG: cytidine deaminase [Saccharofermentanales bacterium]